MGGVPLTPNTNTLIAAEPLQIGGRTQWGGIGKPYAGYRMVQLPLAYALRSDVNDYRICITMRCKRLSKRRKRLMNDTLFV